MSESKKINSNSIVCDGKTIFNPIPPKPKSVHTGGCSPSSIIPPKPAPQTSSIAQQNGSVTPPTNSSQGKK